MNDMSLAAMKRHDDAYCLLLDLCYVCYVDMLNDMPQPRQKPKKQQNKEKAKANTYSLSLKTISTHRLFFPTFSPYCRSMYMPCRI